MGRSRGIGSAVVIPGFKFDHGYEYFLFIALGLCYKTLITKIKIYSTSSNCDKVSRKPAVM